jgi:Acetoacetate decarboxylase (ADC)
VSTPPEGPSASDDYPPAPWALRGQMYFSVWRVPVERVQVRLDPTFELLSLAGRVCVAACFVDYQEGRVLTYGELFGAVSVKVRDTRRYGFTVTHMWVDSERSMHGGRALWGMPKELARFELDHQPPEGAFAGASWDPRGNELARVRFKAIPGLLPRFVRIPLGLPNLQVLHGRAHAPRGAIRFSPQLLRADWSIPAESPLASLGIAGVRPWLSGQVRDFEWNLSAPTPVD